MAYLIDYNKINTSSGYEITTPARIRQYLEIKNKLVLNISPSISDIEYGKFNDGNVLCFDEYGKLLWHSKSKNVAEIFLKKNRLCFYDTSSIGYICVINIENGEIIELIPTK